MSQEWTYLLADLRTGLILAETPLAGANPIKKLNASGTCSGSIPLRYCAGDIYRQTTPGRTCLYVLLDGQPYWGGIIWSRSYDGGSGVVQIQASDWWSYFDRRYVMSGQAFGSADDGKTANGSWTVTNVGQNQHVRDLMARAASYTGGDIGIEVRQLGTGVGKLISAQYFNYKLATYGQVLTDLSNLVDGPDLMFDTAGWDAQGRPRRLLRMGTPELTHRSDVLVFEYGASLMDYSWPSDGTKLATRSWATGSGNELSTMMYRGDNTARLAQGWPLLETSVQYTNLTTAAQVKAQAASDMQPNRVPMVTPTVVVRTDRPPYLTEYQPGDKARLVIRDDYFRNGIAANVRIIDVAPKLGENTATLTVNPIPDTIT